MAVDDPLIGTELGPEFDQGVIQANTVRLKLGSGLALQLDGTIVATTADEPLAAATVTGNANANGALLTLTGVRDDGAWSIGGNAISFAGTPDRVRISAQVFTNPGDSNAFARIAPRMSLRRNGADVAIANSSYQRHNSNHSESSNTISFTDPNPGNNPSYTLFASQGSSQTDVLPVALGSISCEAKLQG